MKIIDIFVLRKFNDRLWTMKYDYSKDSAYDDFIEKYTDINFLEDYFENHKDLLREHYPRVSLEQAVMDTVEEIDELEEYLLQLTGEDTDEDLEDFFKPLHKIHINPRLTESKAYGILYEKSWIRLYGLRIDYNLYVITGGGIKLVRAMQDDILLNEQLNLLEISRNYLLENDIECEEDF